MLPKHFCGTRSPIENGSSKSTGADMDISMKQDLDEDTEKADHLLLPPQHVPAPRCKTASIRKPLDSSRWMSLLPDSTPLSNLTLPGTHDSAAFTTNWPFIATQNLNILAQLSLGIRYFDFRCAVRNDIVEMVHGIRFLGLSLQVLLHTMYTWLSRHPSEAIIVQIKQDRRGQNSGMDFAAAIIALLGGNEGKWRMANSPCTLGELRGRIQLFRRFTGPNEEPMSYGVDVTEWQDNPVHPFTICTAHDTRITIQDHYKFPSGATLPVLIRKKGAAISELLNLAASDEDPDHWYISFTSAYELNLRYQIPPRPIAVGGYWWSKWEEGVNVRLSGWLQEHGRGRRRFGVVAMDFPEQGAEDLVEALIQTNFEGREGMGWILLLGWIVEVVVIGMLCMLLWRFVSSGGDGRARHGGFCLDGLDGRWRPPVEGQIAIAFEA